MPTIQVGIGIMTKEKKKELIERITEVVSDVAQLPKQTITIIIDEKHADNIGVGGVQLSETKK
jgi:4-oxalocrotonate tautomerase